MIISDGTLRLFVQRDVIGIDPFDDEAIQPASYDVRASGLFRVFRNDGSTHIDPRIDQPTLTVPVEQIGDKPFVLHPGEFVLGSTIESFRLPRHIVGRLEGKSSLGRLGLVIHSTAGFIDPGFDGTITLELSNAATLPICLWANMPIGQVSFQFLDEPCEVPYGDPRRKSKYQGQIEPTASKMHENFSHHTTMKEFIDREREELGKPNILPPATNVDDRPLGRPIPHELRPFTEPPEVCICIDGVTDILCAIHGMDAE